MKRRVLLSLVLSMAIPGLFLRLGYAADVQRQERKVADFDRVAVHGVIDLAVTQGGREQLFVTAEPRLLPNIVTRVEHGTLIIETTGNVRTEKKLKAELTVRDLRQLAASDSTEVRIERLQSPQFSLEVVGSATVRASRLTLDALTLRASGSASAELGGKANSQKVQLGGSADYRGGELDCATAHIVASGSSSGALKVRDRLEAEVSGSADVTYVGNPKVRSRVGDAASLERG